MDKDSVDECLGRAAKRELVAVYSDSTGDVEKAATNKRAANLYFRKAMQNDGHPEYKEDVI